MTFIHERLYTINPLAINDETEECFAALLSDKAIEEFSPRVAAAVEHAKQDFPCVCGPEYTERGLRSPRCDNHYIGELVAECIEIANKVEK